MLSVNRFIGKITASLNSPLDEEFEGTPGKIASRHGKKRISTLVGELKR